MSIEYEVDKLLASKNKHTKKRIIKKSHLMYISTSIVLLSLGTYLAMPFLDKKPTLPHEQTPLESKETLLGPLGATFGNSAGSRASWDSIVNAIVGGYFTMGSTGGTADSITGFIAVNTDAKDMKCALYDSSSNLVANSETPEVSVPIQGFTWTTFTYTGTKPVLEANENYYIVAWSEAAGGGVGVLAHETTAGVNNIHRDLEGYGSFPDPASFTNLGSSTTSMIYCTYTEDTTPPVVNIAYVGNISDDGGPNYVPPTEEPTGTSFAGAYTDGYFTNDSMQRESDMVVRAQVTDSGAGVGSVYLHLYNVTAGTWDNTTEMTLHAGTVYQCYLEGNVTIIAGHNYSFNVYAEDAVGNTKTAFWNKTGIGGGLTRRYVRLGCPTNTSFNYSAFYMEQVNYTGTSKSDRLHHDQGGDGTVNDTWYYLATVPDDYVDWGYCRSWIGGFLEESMAIPDTKIENLWIHQWWSSNHTDPTQCNMTYGWNKTRSYSNGNWYDQHYTTYADGKSHVYYDMGITDSYMGYTTTLNNNFSLLCDVMHMTVEDSNVTDNSMYEYAFGYTAAKLSLPKQNYPVGIGNRSFVSCIIPNIPDNATLNASYADSDSDGLSDWYELYKSFTIPFLSDTDNDGINDYWEDQSGSDPNNWTDTYNVTSKTWQQVQKFNISYSNYSRDEQIQKFNISYSNSSFISQIQKFNISYSNSTLETQAFKFNISYSNYSRWEQIQKFNISYSNTSTQAWQQVQKFNISYSNYSRIEQIQKFNISYSNTSTQAWQQVQKFNISYSNYSRNEQIQKFNISYSNTSKVWEQISKFNISYSNSSRYIQVQKFNISYSNSTPPIVTNVTITNEYPENDSIIQDLQPTVYFTLTTENGTAMDYKIFIGNSTANTTLQLTSVAGVANGTYHYTDYYTATNYSIDYFWRVQVSCAGAYTNATFSFEPIPSGGEIQQSNGALGIAAGAFLVAGIAIIFVLRRRKR